MGDEPDDFVGVGRRRDGGIYVVVLLVIDDVLGVHHLELCLQHAAEDLLLLRARVGTGGLARLGVDGDVS